MGENAGDRGQWVSLPALTKMILNSRNSLKIATVRLSISDIQSQHGENDHIWEQIFMGSIFPKMEYFQLEICGDYGLHSDRFYLPDPKELMRFLEFVPFMFPRLKTLELHANCCEEWVKKHLEPSFTLIKFPALTGLKVIFTYTF